MATLLKVILCKRLASFLCMKAAKSKPATPPSIDLAEKQAVNSSNRLLERENHTEQPEKFRANNDFNSTDLLLMRICDRMETKLRSAAEEREKADGDDEIKNEWMLAAAVIDRLFFIIFSFLFIGGTSVFFMAFSLTT